MGSRFLIVCAALASLALGCDEAGRKAAEPENSAGGSSTASAFTWADDDEREHYVTAYVVCSGHLEMLASKYEVEPLPEEVAKEHVRVFAGRGAIGAYHGCLDALLGAPNKGLSSE
jgi:hypothetical protein